MAKAQADSVGFDDDVSITKLFMRRFIAKLRDMLPIEDVDKALRKARSSAGGTMKSRKRKTTYADGESALKFADDRDPIFTPKKEKSAVGYKDASAMGEQCGACRFFSMGGACNLVEGSILPDAVCDLFEVRMLTFKDRNVADLCAGSRCDASVLLFNELQEFSDPPEWIPFLPKPGEYSSPKYGKIVITNERNENFIRNFDDGVYQTKLPISSEHIDADPEGAYGWIEGMRMNEDGSVDAKVMWTDRGVEAIENDRFMYFSPEFHDVYKDNKEVIHKDVAVGGALTTRPFFKEDDMRPLVASDGVLTFSEGDNAITFTTAAHRRKEEDMETSANKDEGAAEEKGALTRFREGLVTWIEGFKDEGEGSPKASKFKAKAKDNAEDEEDEDGKNKKGKKPLFGGKKAKPFTKGNDNDRTINAEEDAERIAALEQENAAFKAREERDSSDLVKANDRIEALEDRNEAASFHEVVNGGGDPDKRWFGKPSVHVEHMLDLKKAFGEGSKQLKHYIATQQAQVTAMNIAGLFDERGSGFSLDVEDAEADTPSGALGELRKLATDLVKTSKGSKDPLTFERAFVEVSAENPELKKKYREQFRSRDTVRS